METRNNRYLESIRKEKKQAEARYGIKIGRTDITCAICGKRADFFHICQNMPEQRKEKIQEIKEEFERPISLMGSDGWRLELGIEIGMSRQEALDKFLDWQANKKTCQRCEGKKYFDCCPIRLICKEAMENGTEASRKFRPTMVRERPLRQTRPSYR